MKAPATRDGRRGILKWSAAASSLGLLAGCTVGGLLSSLTASGGARRVAAQAYGDDPRQQLDLYLPASGARWPTSCPRTVGSRPVKCRSSSTA